VAKKEPNHLYRWDYPDDDEELRTWLPWWAPKCVVGHLYIPFSCKYLRVPEQCAAEIKTMCGGQIDQHKWQQEECCWEIEPFLKSETIESRRVFHRLPVWLIVLPSTGGLVPCLYATVHHWDEFQISAAAISKRYGEYYAAITPSFVGRVGEQIESDAVFFLDNHDDCDPTYICVHDNAIDVIGWRVNYHADCEVENFECDLMTASWPVHDLPDWLLEHPVQRLLKLTVDSDAANGFALSPRVFPKDLRYRRLTWGIDDSETIFRPAFPSGPETSLTAPVRQNTIAAFLLQDFVSGNESTVFRALKDDTIAKAKAAEDLVVTEGTKFQSMFDGRYEK
jgi:hypothetical protein